jgi:lipopolysaccharide export system protein LptA
MKIARSIVVSLALAAAAPAQLGTESFGFLEQLGSDVKIDSDNDANFDAEKGAFIWSGNVHMVVQGTELFADRAEFDTKLEEIRVTGNVSIYREGVLYRGERATYRVRTQEISASEMRSSFEPVFFTTDQLDSNLSEISVVNTENTSFTTDDNPDPDWFIKANRIEIYPEDRVVFRNPKFYVGDVPILWLPYLSQPLQEDLGYQFTPGYSSQWGAYLLNRYGTLWGDHSIVQFLLDGRTERGLAGGLNLSSQRWRGNPNFGKFQAYYAHDTDPQTSVVSSRAEDRSNLDSDRYRINFHHRVYLPGPEESTLYIDFDINKVSDEYFYEDFFPNDFRLDPQPDNIITLTKQHERGELSVLTRFELNDFYRNDTRLPEIALDFTRQPIFNTGAFYWGSTTFGLYEDNLSEATLGRLRTQADALEDDIRLADQLATRLSEASGLRSPLGSDLANQERRTLLDDLRNQLEPNSFSRLYSYHEVLYPITLGGAVSVTPKIGGGAVNYADVDGPQPDNSTRGIFSAGVDIATKFSKFYGDIQVPKLGLDGVMHVIQPYVNYSYVNADEIGDSFRGVDRLVPTNRLRPLDVPQFTAVDGLNSWNIFRLGVENRLLTRRGSGSHPWLVSNTYFDTFIEDPEFDRDFSNLFEEISWFPLPWLRANIGAQLPVFGGDYSFTELNSGVTFMPTRDFEFNISHRFLQDNPFFLDSNLVDLRTYFRLTENWGFSSFHRYEFEDSTFETQQYTLHRDLNTWTAALGFLFRDNRGEEETGVVLSLTLKDFPNVNVPLGIDALGGGN